MSGVNNRQVRDACGHGLQSYLCLVSRVKINLKKYFYNFCPHLFLTRLKTWISRDTQLDQFNQGKQIK